MDTCKAETARQALAAGAHVVNDVTALRGDPDMAAVVRDSGAGVVLMHMQGTPPTMQVNPVYADVVEEVSRFLEARLQAAADVGIAGAQVVLDPGVGFGKTAEHNLELLARLAELQRLGRPVCLGVSRKGFLGKLLGRPVEERLAGSVAAVCHALAHGAAQMVRVHDVAETRDAVRLFQALKERRRRPVSAARSGALQALADAVAANLGIPRMQGGRPLQERLTQLYESVGVRDLVSRSASSPWRSTSPCACWARRAAPASCAASASSPSPSSSPSRSSSSASTSPSSAASSITC